LVKNVNFGETTMYEIIIISTGIIIYFLIKWLIRYHSKIKKLEERLESHDGKIDLELATLGQIIKELVKRPNYQFMFIVPHFSNDERSLNVEIHSSNISMDMALDTLRVTYQGVADHMRENGQEDIDEDDL